MRALNNHQSLLASRPAAHPAWHSPYPPTSYIGLLLNSLGAGYFSIDPQYRIIDVNAHALNWLSMTRNMVVGRPFSEIIPRSPMKMLKAAIEQKVFVDRQMPSYQRPDRLVDLHIYPTNDGAILFFNDLTAQDLLQQETARGKALLQSSLDALTAHVVVLDGSGTVVASNAAWQQFSIAQGLHTPGAARLNYLALYSKPLARRRDALRIGETLTSLLSGNARTARIVHTWPLKNKVCWFQLNAARFECWGDTFIIVANEDVTAVKEAERASGEMAERLLTLQEEERRRIAEELHDSTAQHLVAIGLNMMKLKSKLPERDQHSELFGEIEASVRETSKELRTFTYLLHPPRLDEEGLRATARQYARGFACRTGLHVDVNVTDVGDAAPFEVQRCIFRIMQEGLTNIHRHASASQVRLDLRYLRQQLHLIVRDNGVGMDTVGGNRDISMASSMGVGIPGMKARLRQFGGELAIRSGPAGTCLHVIIPFVPEPTRNNGQNSPYVGGYTS